MSVIRDRRYKRHVQGKQQYRQQAQTRPGIALLFSRGATVLKSPLIVGYIVAGAILGPAVLNIISNW